MRTWPQRTSTRTLTALAAGAVMVAGSGTAYADLIVNGVDDSIDTTVEQMPLSLSTGPGQTTIYVVGAEGDGDPGCNLDGGTETVTLNIASDNAAVATVSPSTLVLSACGAVGAQTVTVTPKGVGTATFTTTVATGSNNSGGSFSIANARFAAKVTTVPNTPPKLDIVGVEEGGTYARGTLQRPSCVATDPDDVPAAPHTKTWPAPMTHVTGPYAVDSIGTRYAMCSYTDEYGVQVLARKGFSIVDDSAPVISRNLNPSTPENGWFRGDVTLNHTVTENQSPSSLQPLTGCDSVTVAEDTRLRTVTCSATSAGGTNTVTTNIRRDATAPVVNATSTVTGGGTVVNGWYTSPVSVAFTATDETSLFLVDGRAVGTSTQTVPVKAEGEVVVESPVFTDRAGNTSVAGAVKRTVKVDTTAPAAPTFVGGPTGSHYFGEVPAAPTCTSSDSTSGLASCVVTGGGSTVGEHSYTATATDNAGHTSTAVLPYEVLAWTAADFTSPIDMDGVYNTVKGGSTVPAKFEVFAGTEELTDTSLVAFSNKKISCTTSAPVDEIESVVSGSTSLKYDAVAGQFQYNWKLPTGTGTCYELTMTADDGSTVSARFRLK